LDLLVAQAPVAEVPPTAVIELRLSGGRSSYFESTIDPTALSVLIRSVDAA
jgi:transposase